MTERPRPRHPRRRQQQRSGLVASTDSPFRFGFVAALGALLAYWLLTLVRQASGVLLLIVVALFLAVGLSPLVDLLVRRGLRRTLAVTVVALGLLAVVGLFVVAIVPVVRDQISTMLDNAPGWIDQLRTNSVLLDLDERFAIFEKLEEKLGDSNLASTVFGGALGIGRLLLGAVFNTVVIFALTLYFLAGLSSIEQAFYRLAPASRRARTQELTEAVLAQIGSYVAGAFGVALTAGISTTVFLSIVGLGEYAVALGVVVALLDFIPMIGATIGAVIVCLVAFATSAGIGIACVIFFVIYQQIENYVIYPKIMARSMSIPGVVTVIAALIGGALLGVVGALLAIPTAASILFIVREVVLPRQERA